MTSMLSDSSTPPNSDPLLILHRGPQTLKFSLNQPVHRLGRGDPDWSDLTIFETDWAALSPRHAKLHREGQDYRIYDGDDEGNRSQNGILLNHKRIGAEGYLLTGNTELEIGQDPQNQIILLYVNPLSTRATSTPQPHRRLNLRSCQIFPVVLGQAEETRYEMMQLDAPTVSRRHAEIDRASPGQYILRDCSTYGTFVNDQRVLKPIALESGDVIRIGPFTLRFAAEELELYDRGKQIRIDAHQLLRCVNSKRHWRTILQNVSLAIEPGQLVALVGGSGAGKTTLMKTLLGIEPTTSGAVYVNGHHLRQYFNLYRSQVGYVPQDDILHRELTVWEVLFYACQLRLPPDVNVAQVVNQTIDRVKLTHERNTIVTRLSGGQRKRVSIAVELLADPGLFFLDEPTSGLDPGLDLEVMELLQRLAQQGRTIVLVTHTIANIDVCDRVAVMGQGGRLCYFGPPAEALPFFGITPDLRYFAKIYQELAQGETPDQVDRHVQRWAEQFAESSLYQTYIQSRLSVSRPGIITGQATPRSGSVSLSYKPPKHPIRQLQLLTQRSSLVVWRDRLSLVISLLAAPIGIALIRLPLRDQDPLAQAAKLSVTQAPLALRVLFVITCAALWVGLSSSVQDIVKETSIYARERLVNLGLLPYLGSKVLVRGGLALLQSLLITGSILVNFRSPEPTLLPWILGVSITTFLNLLASFSLGLMISAFVSNENQASSALPLVLLPQIIFSGVLFKLDNAARVMAWFMIGRWSMGAYGALVDVNRMVPVASNPPGVVMPPPPFEPTPMYDPTWENLLANWLMLGIHTSVYLLIALYRQKRKDVF